MTMFCRICFLLIAMLSSSLLNAEDALYTAEHSGQCSKWELSFYQSGFVNEMYEEYCGNENNSYSKLHRITQGQLQDLRAVFGNAKLKELPKSIEPKTFVTDEDIYCISIHSGNDSVRVGGYGLDRAKNPSHASRFM